MLALIALICFAIAAVLKLASTAFGAFDYTVFALVGLAFLAAAAVPFGALTRRG